MVGNAGTMYAVVNCTDYSSISYLKSVIKTAMDDVDIKSGRYIEAQNQICGKRDDIAFRPTPTGLPHLDYGSVNLSTC